MIAACRHLQHISSGEFAALVGGDRLVSQNRLLRSSGRGWVGGKRKYFSGQGGADGFGVLVGCVGENDDGQVFRGEVVHAAAVAKQRTVLTDVAMFIFVAEDDAN